MLQNPCKTLGFKKNMVYKIPPGGGGKPYPASGLYGMKNTTQMSERSTLLPWSQSTWSNWVREYT